MQGHLLHLDPWLLLSSLFLLLLIFFLLLSTGGFCYGVSDVLFCLAVAAFTIYLILTVASYRFVPLMSINFLRESKSISRAVLVETTCPQR